MESKENIELLNKDKNNKKESNIHVINNPSNKNINLLIIIKLQLIIFE